jgi:membrane-associated phospholipid phosphatase
MGCVMRCLMPPPIVHVPFCDAAAATVLVASSVLARRRRVPAWEAWLFRRVNSAPERIRVPAWVVMQAGSAGAIVAAAGMTALRHGRRQGAVVFDAGSATWLGMKFVKPLVARRRPDAYLDGVIVRGNHQNGLGHPSGHAAVAMTLALATTAQTTTAQVTTGRPTSRAITTGIAILAGCGRMYTGAHLPLDVVGGLAAGTLIGRLASAVCRRVSAGSRRATGG